jgi:hypothetical protein
MTGKDYDTWQAECGVGDTGFVVEQVWTRNNSDGTPTASDGYRRGGRAEGLPMIAVAETIWIALLVWGSVRADAGCRGPLSTGAGVKMLRGNRAPEPRGRCVRCASPVPLKCSIISADQRSLTMAQPVPVRSAKVSVPEHLAAGPEGELYATIARSYGIRDAASLQILTETLTSLKIARECHEQIARDGRTHLVAGSPRLHPLCATERDARSAFLVGIKTLNLELPKTTTGGWA